MISGEAPEVKAGASPLVSDSITVDIKVSGDVLRLTFRTHSGILTLSLTAQQAALLSAQIAFATAKLLDNKPKLFRPL